MRNTTFADRDKDPLVPVTVARELPTEEPLQANVDVPAPAVMLVAESVQDKVVELVVTTRAADPENPFTGASVIVAMPVTAAFTMTLAALAVTVKSWI